MPRLRRKTETFGCLVTLDERRVILEYLKSHRLTQTQYLYEAAVMPLMNAVWAREVEPDGQD